MAAHDPLLRPEKLKRLLTATATKLPSRTGQRNDVRLVMPKAAVEAAIESAAARERASGPSEAIPGH